MVDIRPPRSGFWGWEMKMEIAGKSVQYDRSGGQGHAWVSATGDNTPANVSEEIAAEILEGKIAESDDYRASNGQHYRWS